MLNYSVAELRYLILHIHNYKKSAPYSLSEKRCTKTQTKQTIERPSQAADPRGIFILVSPS